MNIVSRAQWGARYPAGAGPAPLPAREVWLHHSVTVAPDLVPPFDDDDAAMRLLEQIGQQKFAQGVSYTFAIMPNGRTYEGHGVDRLGAHTKGRNSIARAIVLVGNYDTAPPTAAQIESTAQLLVDGVDEGWWDEARLDGGHQQAPGAVTACPGRHAMAVIGDINTRAAAIADGAPLIEEDDVGHVDSISGAVLNELADHIWRKAQQTRSHGDAAPIVLLEDTRSITGALTKGADVDEEALAVALAPLLSKQLERLPLEDLQELMQSVVTEQARRLSAALAASAPAPAAALALVADVDEAMASDLDGYSLPAVAEEPAGNPGFVL